MNRVTVSLIPKSTESHGCRKFRNGIRKYCLNKTETLQVLGNLCREEKMVLGISEEVYENLEGSEKESFFESILQKKALRRILSKNLPLVALLQEFFPGEIEARRSRTSCSRTEKKARTCWVFLKPKKRNPSCRIWLPNAKRKTTRS